MDITESNLWFYAFSTIAQTCAAILALGGTFVVFKLDKAKNGINNYRGRILEILYVWRGPSKTPDKFYDESDEDVLGQYMTVVSTNNETIFDKPDLNYIYARFENVRETMIEPSGNRILSNGVILDHKERKRWCERMASLYKKNILIEKLIVRLFKIALISLSFCIIVSIFLLISKGHNLPVGINILTCVVILTALTIIYSAISFWLIARARPID
ncbi:MAG: hypothetical protein PHH01_03740 [Patescibacteria group bacterium]|nr:hypothetical protein [Patescibacteria group bacterium]